MKPPSQASYATGAEGWLMEHVLGDLAGLSEVFTRDS